MFFEVFMLKWILHGCLFFSMFGFITAMAQSNSTESPKQINIGFIPSTSTEKLKTEALELATLLQDKLGISVNVFISKNYTGLVEAMKNKKVDFAFLSPFTFVMAEKNAQARVLMKKVYEAPFYYSIIAAKKNSSIKKLENLQNKNFAFVDEKSTSGFLYPIYQFKKMGIDYKKFFKKIDFTGNHKSSVEELDQQKVDAIAVFSDDEKGTKSALTLFGKSIDHYKVLWVSEPIPNDPFCVRGDFYDQYPKITHELMMTMIDLSERKELRPKIGELLGRQGMALATQKQFDVVRDLVKNLDIKVE